MRRIFVSVALLVSGCQTPRIGDDVYHNPQVYVGQVVTVCGAHNGANLIRADSRDASLVGLSIVDHAPEGRRRGAACVTGTIVRVGCELDVVCTDWAYEYGIEVRSIRWL